MAAEVPPKLMKSSVTTFGLKIRARQRGYILASTTPQSIQFLLQLVIIPLAFPRLKTRESTKTKPETTIRSPQYVIWVVRVRVLKASPLLKVPRPLCQQSIRTQKLHSSL
ncbi:hypothetical protein V6N13_023295 [Hibiscus sabdariffa]